MKFATAKQGDQVYIARLGKGVVTQVTDGKIYVRHQLGDAMYDLDGYGVYGRLHWFGSNT